MGQQKLILKVYRPLLLTCILLLLLLFCREAEAAFDCTSCHRMPPLDSPTRDPRTGGFVGNHQAHLPVNAESANCSSCHDSAGFTTSHLDRRISIPANINDSPGTGQYKVTGVALSFKNQTSVPVFGSCFNVNCHFEKVTKPWGSGNFTYTDTTTNDCGQCHGAPPAGIATAPGAAGSHAKHDAYYAGTTQCKKCHADHVSESAKFAHATSAGNRNLIIQTKDPQNAAGGTYSGPLNDYLPSQTNTFGSCIGLYCHSDGTKAAGTFTTTSTAKWGRTLTCSGCHRSDYTSGVSMATGSHQSHVNKFGSAYNTIKCNRCHAVTATSGMTISNNSHHVNKQVEIAFNNSSSAANGYYIGTLATPTSPMAKAPGSPVGQCTNIYCHSTGQGTNGTWPPTYTSPTWGDSDSGYCGTCHGNQFNHVFPPTTTPTPLVTGSHTKHLSYQLSVNYRDYERCVACHAYKRDGFDPDNCNQGLCHSPANQKHANYEVNVGIPTYFGYSASYYGSSRPGDGYSSCTNVYCHSDGKSTPTYTPAVKWGGQALSCTGCHGNAAGNGAGGTPLSGKHSAHLNPAINASLGLGNGLGCADCHAKTVGGNTSISSKLKHVNRFIDFSSIHGGGSYSTATHLCSNIYCHSNGNSALLVYTNPAGWDSTTTYGCNGCHGTSKPSTGAPDYTNGGAGTTTANSHSAHVWGATNTTICSDCHIKTASMAVAGRFKDYSAASYHMNGTPNVNFNKAKAGAAATWNHSSGQCSNIACHGNTTATWGSSGGCLTCHEGSIGNRCAIGPQFSGNSHHIQGSAITGAHCYQCHWEANSDGSINHTYHHSNTPGAPVELVVYGPGTRPVAYTAGTTAIQYTANGTRSELAKINAHCLACHSAQNDTSTPFGEGKTPKAYAWDNTSIGTRYGDTGTTPWGKYSGGNVTPKNSRTKAFSAHGNATANQGGWDLNETWPNKRAGATNILCFDCHNSHGSTVGGTTTSYASATVNGGILKDTTTGKGGYSTTYKPAAGGLTGNHNAYNPGAGLCFDCHLSASPGLTPWGYNATFGATQAILGYMDTPYFGLGSFGTQQRYPYKSTANMGGHLGASSILLVSATRPINGLCTPCHDPHGISTTIGSNRQFAVPLLKGTWVTSPYKEDAATRDNRAYLYLASPGQDDAPRPTAGTFAAYTSAIKSYKIDQNTFASGSITQTDAQFGGLCLSCHPKTSLTNGTTHTWKSKDRVHESVKGWKTANTTIQHNYSCSKCHAPHNARLPRLMTSNCLDYRHRGRVTNNTNPITSGSYRGEEGSGSGDIPGSYSGGKGSGSGGSSGQWTDWNSNPPSRNVFTCHENYDSGQKWNLKTPWTK